MGHVGKYTMISNLELTFCMFYKNLYFSFMLAVVRVVVSNLKVGLELIKTNVDLWILVAELQIVVAC
jgi:hypothetical protein